MRVQLHACRCYITSFNPPTSAALDYCSCCRSGKTLGSSSLAVNLISALWGVQVGWQPSYANRTAFLQTFKSTYVAPYYEVRSAQQPCML